MDWQLAAPTVLEIVLCVFILILIVAIGVIYSHVRTLRAALNDCENKNAEAILRVEAIANNANNQQTEAQARTLVITRHLKELEEKQTDVNIAINLYRDAILENAEQVILVSGDSDLTPVLELIQKDRPNIKIGVIFPIPYNEKMERRSINRSLENASNWTRKYIKENEFEHHQLPPKVPTNKKPLIKPDYW